MAIAKLVALGSLRRLSWCGNDDAAVRTTHTYTLGARLNEVTGIVDDWKRRMRDGESPPVQLFDGTKTDLSKQVGLKAVAAHLAEHGTIGLSAAEQLFDEKRVAFLELVTKRFYPGGTVGSCDTFQPTKIRRFLYETLPVVAVPYRACGQDGKNPMLLVPDVPTFSDAKLEEALKPCVWAAEGGACHVGRRNGGGARGVLAHRG